MSEHEQKPDTADIRELELDDLADVYRLGEEVFTSEQWPTLHRTWDEYVVTSAFMTDRETSLVAYKGGELVGFALGTLIEKPGSSWVYGYLEWLGVAPAHKRNGIGRQLVQAIRRCFIQAGASMLLVDTEKDNEGALNLFRSLGFGNAAEHVYLSLNLTNEDDYLRHKKQKD